MEQLDFIKMFSDFVAKAETGKQFPTITRESKISDLGLDSIVMMQIVGEVEDELNIRIPDEKLARLNTVGDIERAVLERMQ